MSIFGANYFGQYDMGNGTNESTSVVQTIQKPQSVLKVYKPQFPKHKYIDNSNILYNSTTTTMDDTVHSMNDSTISMGGQIQITANLFVK